MINTKDLLPCPFCKCSDISVKNETPADNSDGYFIECPDCGISTSLRYACGDDPIPLLVEQWNRRTSAQCLHQIAEPAQAARSAFEAISRFMKCEWSLDWDPAGFYDDAKTDTAFTWFEQGYMRAQQAAAPQAVQAAVPDGWVPCVITYEGQHPEEIAYGPQAMMDRLKKWLDRYFEMRTAPAHPAEGVPAQAVIEALDRMDALLRPGLGLLSVGDNSATANASRADMATIRAALAATQPAAQGMEAQALKRSFREYLSVSEHIDAGGHAMDSIATDLTRIVLAEEEVSAVIARRVHCNTSGQSGEDAENIRAAAQAKQAGV